ncbi:MAG: peptidase T [Eubacteriales bacterium]|nr:peptidase T [Eubacteriales bacterium]
MRHTCALDYFLDYVKYDTQSNPAGEGTPSSENQWPLAKRLASDLEALGLEVELSEHCYVYGRLAANDAVYAKQPPLGFIAHIDTAPDFSGANVNPCVLTYTGGDIVLDEAEDIRIEAALFHELETLVGEELVVTDGHSLLGADDKAGVSEIMALFAELQAHPEIKHGPLRVCFTPDEEIGGGTAKFELERFDAYYAYTVDGGKLGELEYENFNAASALIEVEGLSVHPGSAKKRMINAADLAARFVASMDPCDTPRYSEGRQGFYHLSDFTGGVASARIEYIIRDFDLDAFEARKSDLIQRVEAFNNGLDVPRFKITITDQYFNMVEKIKTRFELIENAREAMRRHDIEPIEEAIRGGTDGAMLSYMGLPCPNLFTGGANFHGRYEYLVLSSMDLAVDVLLELVNIYTQAA